ncbi:MAG: hypothetical protein HY804_03865 [Nitrospinae bacterium]|nr:hypothetical protein [Nitrospinota bacterium]
MDDHAPTPTLANGEGIHKTGWRKKRTAASVTDKSRTKFYQIIIIFLLTVGLVPGLFGLLAIYHSSKKELIESKGLYFAQVSALTAFQVEEILINQLNLIRWIAALPTIQNILIGPAQNRTAEQEVLRRVIMPEMAKRYFVVNIYNTNARVVFNSSLENGGDSPLADRATLDAIAKSGKPYVSRFVDSGPPERRYFLIVYQPVVDEAGAYMGAVVVRYEVSSLFDIITSVRVGATGHANLILSSGVILVCPIFSPQSHQVNHELLSAIVSRSPGWMIAGDDAHGGHGSIVGFSKVNLRTETLAPGSFGGEDWYVFTRQEPVETFESIVQFQRAVILYATLFATLVVALGFFAWTQIVKAQQARESQAASRAKSESLKSLLASFKDLIYSPLEEFAALLDTLESRADGVMIEPLELRRVRRRLTSLESILKHLAYYTQTGKAPLSPVNLRAVIEESLALLDYLIASKRIQIVRITPEDPLLIMGHFKLLSIVVMNILLNSIHALQDEGVITITTSVEDGWATMVIHDNGDGIPPEDLELVFDPFFTTKKREKGFGLGLAVSKGIIEAHHGKILVRSDIGAGTEVLVSLARSDGGITH